MKTDSMITINKKQVQQLEMHKTNPEYCSNKQQVFILGSKGIPANYGGFETFVEKLTEYQLNDDIRYHVSRLGNNELRYQYNGAKCFNVKVPNVGAAKAIYYDVAALRRSIKYCEVRPSIKHPIFYVLACRMGPLIGYYKKRIDRLGGKLYVNPDGHEWKRKKWSGIIRGYWKISEKMMVKHADLLICDNKNIEKYINEEYKKYQPKTIYIAYGSDLEPSILHNDDKQYNEWLERYCLKTKKYYLAVGRFVPENNYLVMIREFMKTKSLHDFVIITNISKKFLVELKRQTGFDKDKRIKFVDTVYEPELLKKIRENSYAYFHGHEVGGTNPSLLEALATTDMNLLLDVCFNREVAEKAALYWTKKEGNLSLLIEKIDSMSEKSISQYGKLAKIRIFNEYSWQFIVEEYEELFLGE